MPGTELTLLNDVTEDIETLKTAVTAIQAAVEQVAIGVGAPADATAFCSTNASAVAAEATPQQVVAKPGAGTAIYVQAVLFSNVTAADVAILKLQDEDDNAIMAQVAVGDPAVSGKGTWFQKFPTPIKLTDAKALEVACVGDVGDSYATVWGYVL